MPKHEKPLPEPPATPFGRKKTPGHSEEQETLLADRMAAAMAEGTIEEFLKKEMPDNEYARKLATMMMGMTGMLPAEGAQPSLGKTGKTPSAENSAPEQMPNPAELPEEVVRAVQGGDVKGLMGLLHREHQKRSPGSETAPGEETAPPQPAVQPAIDKDIIDTLIRIASDNSVALDWIILRAIKVYVEEYQKTGRL